jgi:DNA-binding NarL/FixJ family response regulator
LPVITILLVDDFEPWHAVIKLFVKLNSLLQIIDTAGSGAEAIEKAHLLQPNLVLLDVGLPGISGIEAATHIRRVSPGSKIIFLTENDCEMVKERALGTGACSYVLKSDVAHSLLPAIELAIQEN